MRQFVAHVVIRHEYHLTNLIPIKYINRDWHIHKWSSFGQFLIPFPELSRFLVIRLIVLYTAVTILESQPPMTVTSFMFDPTKVFDLLKAFFWYLSIYRLQNLVVLVAKSPRTFLRQLIDCPKMKISTRTWSNVSKHCRNFKMLKLTILIFSILHIATQVLPSIDF